MRDVIGSRDTADGQAVRRGRENGGFKKCYRGGQSVEGDGKGL